jgi:hypothetical protein
LAKKLPLQVIQAGGNLFALAARLYGDATLANMLARANGLSDPFLQGVVTLSVPAPDATQSGGMPIG